MSFPFSPISEIHLIFDLIAYLTAFITGWLTRPLFQKSKYPVASSLKVKYSFVLLNGVIIGSLALGTLNLIISGQDGIIGKSIIGAIVGGIIAAEFFKKIHNIQRSTGAVFVPALRWSKTTSCSIV